MNRVTFREWSACVDLGQPGFNILIARRAMRNTMQAVMQDALFRSGTGTGIMRIDMGEDCTPIIQRIDPFDFYVHPQDRGDT